VASPEGLQLLVNTDEGQKALLKAAIGRNEGVSDSTIEDLYGSYPTQNSCGLLQSQCQGKTQTTTQKRNEQRFA
jgi:hypothetical protein